MSDQEIRALERQTQADPADSDAQIKLFTARRRAGIPVESYFRLRNTQNGKFYQYWDRYSGMDDISPGRVHETTNIDTRINAAGFFKDRLSALKEVAILLKRGADLTNYQLVEFQTMTMEIAGPSLASIQDEIEVELLQAKKEQQLKKLRKLETEEQELLKQRTLAEKAKLEKLEAKETSLQKKLKGKKNAAI